MMPLIYNRHPDIGALFFEFSMNVYVSVLWKFRNALHSDTYFSMSANLFYFTFFIWIHSLIIFSCLFYFLVNVSVSFTLSNNTDVTYCVLYIVCIFFIDLSLVMWLVSTVQILSLCISLSHLCNFIKTINANNIFMMTF